MKHIIVLSIGIFIYSFLNAQDIRVRVTQKDMTSPYRKLSYTKLLDARPTDLTSFKEAGDAMIKTANELQKKHEANTEKINAFFVEVLKLKVPENCEIYKNALLQDIENAKDKYIEENGGIMFATDIGNVMYKAYLQSENLKLIEKQIELNSLEVRYDQKISEQVKNKELLEEIKIICNFIIPILHDLKISNIDYYCYEIITSLSLDGYIKGSNNYLGITQKESLRGINKNYPDLPTKYETIRDFTLDYYDLYIKSGNSIFEESAAISAYRNLIKHYYNKEIIAALLAL